MSNIKDTAPSEQSISRRRFFKFGSALVAGTTWELWPSWGRLSHQIGRAHV